MRSSGARAVLDGPRRIRSASRCSRLSLFCFAEAILQHRFEGTKGQFEQALSSNPLARYRVPIPRVGGVRSPLLTLTSLGPRLARTSGFPAISP